MCVPIEVSAQIQAYRVCCVAAMSILKVRTWTHNHCASNVILCGRPDGLRGKSGQCIISSIRDATRPRARCLGRALSRRETLGWNPRNWCVSILFVATCSLKESPSVYPNESKAGFHGVENCQVLYTWFRFARVYQVFYAFFHSASC